MNLQSDLLDLQERGRERQAHEVSAEARGRFLDVRALRDYALAGRAVVTVRSKATGERFTFKLVRGKPRGDRPLPTFVRVLTGPRNEEHYSYLGVAWPTEAGGLRYAHGTAKSKVEAGAASAKAARWFVECVGLALPSLLRQADVWHEGCCGRCGRTLTVPSSIESGIGPECAKILGRAS